MEAGEIIAIVNKKERETIRFELKAFAKLMDKSDKDIACSIVAFANRFGGKMIFGVDNNGNFEGKFNGNIDKVKENIYNITRDKISPNIDLQVSLVESNEWETVVLDIPQKKTIPYAYIHERKSHEIQTRTYYLRTAHGKKLVSDAELSLLFSSNDKSEGENLYQSVIELNSNLQVFNSGLYSGTESFTVNNFVTKISPEGKVEMQSDRNKVKDLILELYPYLIFKLFMTYYRFSWYIQFTQQFNSIASGAILNEEYEKESHTVTKVAAEGYSILKKIIPDFDTVIASFSIPGFDTFYLPAGSQLKVVKTENASTILIENEKFFISIEFSPLAYGPGLSQVNPLFQDYVKEPGAIDYLQQNFYHLECGIYLRYRINVEKTSYEEYRRLQQYVGTLNYLIKKNWDIDEVLKNIPSREMRALFIDTREILEIVRKLPEKK